VSGSRVTVAVATPKAFREASDKVSSLVWAEPAGFSSKTGTNFIPQIVQLPGLSDVIHGCIGLW